jgi:hypothetical protein
MIISKFEFECEIRITMTHGVMTVLSVSWHREAVMEAGGDRRLMVFAHRVSPIVQVVIDLHACR